MFNKQGMVFYVASAILTNGRYPYIYSSAVVKQCASNRFTNCHTYYLFISGQKLKTYQSSDWKNMPLTCEKLRAPQDTCMSLYRSLYVRIPHGNFPVSVLAPCYRRGRQSILSQRPARRWRGFRMGYRRGSH